MPKIRPSSPGLAERLRLLADLVGGGNALASIGKVSRSSLSLWLGGKVPNEATLERIAARTNVSFLWLSEGVGMPPTAETVHRGAAPSMPIATLSAGIRAIPAFDPSWLEAKWPDIESGRLAMWVVPDDSMAPMVTANEPVLLYLILPGEEPLAYLRGDDTLALVAYEKTTQMLRRVVVQGNQLLFRAENAGTRDLIGYPDEILGVALWCGKTLRG